MRDFINSKLGHTPQELEIIGLKMSVDTIDAIVNRQVLGLGSCSSTHDMEIHFPDDVHQKLFYILLSDLLSRRTDDSLIKSKSSCLERLGEIVRHPLLENDNSIASLRTAYEVFTKWLAKEIDLSIWSGSLGAQLSLHLSRNEIVYCAGNMSKHHFGHLSTVITSMSKQVYSNELQHKLIPALEDIYAELHDNVLNYHSSTIAEMLNELRWGIHNYLLPEFNKSFSQVDDLSYKLKIPRGIKADFAKSCYWSLMNSVRSKPSIDRFRANEILKLQY